MLYRYLNTKCKIIIIKYVSITTALPNESVSTN